MDAINGLKKLCKMLKEGHQPTYKEICHELGITRPVDSLVRLRKMLDKGHQPTYQEICHELDIGTRQARRLIDQLRSNGTQIQEKRDGRSKRFYLNPEHQALSSSNRDFTFDQEEMLALAVSAETAKAQLVDTPLEAPLKRAFDKLFEEFPDPEMFDLELEQEPHRWHFGTPAVSHFDPQVFKTLRRAINESQSVLIDYYAASRGVLTKDRKVEPVQFVRYRGSWLVVAYCRQRRDFRDFSLARIKRVTLHGTYFTSHDDFDPDKYFRNRFGMVNSEIIYPVRLLIEPRQAQYFEQKKYHPTQTIEEKRQDGRLVVSYRVAGLEEIRSFVQGWGESITVLSPAELLDLITRQTNVLAKRYGEGNHQ